MLKSETFLATLGVGCSNTRLQMWFEVLLDLGVLTTDSKCASRYTIGVGFQTPDFKCAFYTNLELGVSHNSKCSFPTLQTSHSFPCAHTFPCVSSFPCIPCPHVSLLAKNLTLSLTPHCKHPTVVLVSWLSSSFFPMVARLVPLSLFVFSTTRRASSFFPAPLLFLF